jgi:hypothetical protein
MKANPSLVRGIEHTINAMPMMNLPNIDNYSELGL